MIRIKKLLVENFKGMRSPTEIDFNNPENTTTNILAGANGFGKTTIFDAIEVCLTGKFHRIKLFNDVQRRNANRARPFYQNIDGQDVVIKLLIENSETEEQFIIIKHYDDVNPITNIGGGRNNIPIESSNFFLTYITDDLERFVSNDFSNLAVSTQEDVDKLIYGSTSNTSLESTYYLFNYIQQEDSLYFLKQSEDTKGKSLGFLFNIVEEEAKQEKLNEIVRALTENRSRLQSEITSLREQTTSVSEIQYKRLFENKQVAFDAQNPFSTSQNSKERLHQFQEFVNELITFKTSFTPEEYDKHLIFKSLNEEVISNRKVLEAILLRTIANQEAINNLLALNEKRNQAEVFLNRSNKELIDDKIFEVFIVDPSITESYKSVMTELKKLNSELGELERIVGDLNQAREKSQIEFKNLIDHKHISETNCPLCDSQFSSFDELLAQIKNKTAALEAHNSNRFEIRKIILTQLEEIYSKVDKIVLDFFNSSKPIEREVEILFRDLPNLTQTIAMLLKKHPFLDSSEITSYLFQEIPVTRTEVDSKISAFKDYLSKTVLVKFQYNEQSILGKHLYSEYFDSDKELFVKVSINDLNEKLNYLKYAQAQVSNNRLQFLLSRLEKLDRIKTKLDTTNRAIFQTIKDHKADMIKRIKIPFYIFSGKILQSYQQGSGIFVDIHQTGQNNNVRFFTGASSDHDIVYHLSSGQMAVVALAFCLSLNKIYNTNHSFKFLAIDDPIQTMDDLNVHTFVELVRNEFSEYQIIMSTHDDFTSRYMKYKFDKFGMKTKIQNVQQLVIEQSLG
jgi:exonuclease SbcC